MEVREMGSIDTELDSPLSIISQHNPKNRLSILQFSIFVTYDVPSELERLVDHKRQEIGNLTEFEAPKPSIKGKPAFRQT